LGVFVLVFLGLVVPVTGVAQAAWWDGGGWCGVTTQTKYTSSGSEFQQYPALLTAAIAGYAEWSVPDNPHGGPEFTYGGQNFNMRWEPAGSQNRATTVCGPFVHDIEFNSDRIDEYLNGSIDIEGVSAHEWGHAHGIGHAGKHDTQAPNSGKQPTMTTCNAASDTVLQRTVEQDDHSAVTRIGDVVGGYGSITPNSSFEDGLAFWRTQSIGSWGTYSGGVDGTPKYVVFTPTYSGSAIFADNRITNASGEKVKARVNYRRHDPASSGQVKMTLKWAEVQYSQAGWCTGADQTFDNLNLNVEIVDSATFSTKQNKYCTVGSSWNYCTTSVYTVPSHWDAADVRVVVYSNVFDGSQRVGVRLDRVRAMAQN
jgi:hypothetical protein